MLTFTLALFLLTWEYQESSQAHKQYKYHKNAESIKKCNEGNICQENRRHTSYFLNGNGNGFPRTSPCAPCFNIKTVKLFNVDIISFTEEFISLQQRAFYYTRCYIVQVEYFFQRCWWVLSYSKYRYNNYYSEDFFII